MANDIWMNIASFDVVDAKRRVVANANVKSIAGASPELLPSRSIMLSAKESVELLPSGPISQQTLLSTVVPALIERGKFNHIDLDTGLFEEQAHGKYSIPEIYRRSVEGLWDVRTRPYASEVIRNVAVADGIRLAAGIVRRWESRRTLRAL
jgi:hypothetical protein